MSKILIVDDEPQIRKLLHVTLRAEGHNIQEAANGEDAIVVARTMLPDLVLLDLGLPDMNGVLVLKEIRSWSLVPIIILTVQNQEEEKVAAFDMGADDYVTKPFSSGELLARIRSSLRRLSPIPDLPVLAFDHVTIDLTQRMVTRDTSPIKLTPIEYDLIRILAINVGRVVTRTQLLTQVWGYSETNIDAHYLRIYIGHLRKKLEQDPARPQLILTEPSVGYRLRTPNHLS